MIHLHAKFHIPSASGSLITTKLTESNGSFSHMSHVFYTFYKNAAHIKARFFPQICVQQCRALN